MLPSFPEPSMDSIYRHIELDHKVEDPWKDIEEWQEIEPIRGLHELHNWYHNKEWYGEHTGPYFPDNVPDDHPKSIPHKHAHADRMLPSVPLSNMLRHLELEHQQDGREFLEDINSDTKINGWKEHFYEWGNDYGKEVSEEELEDPEVFNDMLNRFHQYSHERFTEPHTRDPNHWFHRHASDFAHGVGINGTPLTDTASNNPHTTEQGSSGVTSDLHIPENQDPQYIIGQSEITDPQRNRTFMSNWKDRYAEKKKEKDPITGFEIEDNSETPHGNLTDLWGGIGGLGTSGDKTGND